MKEHGLPHSSTKPQQLLKFRALRHPSRLAIVTSDSEITFEDLYREAVIVSNAIISLRVETGQSVFPILLDNSMDSMITAVAAVISEQTFSPLSAAAEKISQASILEQLPEAGTIVGPEGVMLDSLTPSQSFTPVGLGSGEFREDAGLPDSPQSMVLFSSGSTGRPKGILTTWPRMIERASARDGLHPKDKSHERVLSFSPLNFSYGFHQLVGVFLGFTVYFADLKSVSAKDILRRALDLEVTRMFVTPSIAKLLGRHLEGSAQQIPSLNSIEVSGEKINWEDIQEISSLGRSDTRFLLGMSATESALYMWCDFTAENLPRFGPAPVGNPVKDNVRLVPPPQQLKTDCSKSTRPISWPRDIGRINP